MVRIVRVDKVNTNSKSNHEKKGAIVGNGKNDQNGQSGHIFKKKS